MKMDKKLFDILTQMIHLKIYETSQDSFLFPLDEAEGALTSNLELIDKLEKMGFCVNFVPPEDYVGPLIKVSWRKNTVRRDYLNWYNISTK